MTERFKASSGRRQSHAATRATGGQITGLSAVEKLESRRLLSAEPVGIPGPSIFTTSTTVTSDGTYAYYFSSNTTDTYLADIWRSDGTAAGSRLLGTVSSGNEYAVPREFKLIGGRLFLLGRTGTTFDLYAQDPQTDQIRRVSDFGYPSHGDTPRDLVELNGRAYLVGWTGATGNELFTSDGTPEGTRLAVDLVPGTADGAMRCARAGDNLYLTAQTGQGVWSVYRSNGTQAGTTLLRTFNTGNPYRGPEGFVQVGNRVVFNLPVGNDDVLWVTDGTSANTQSLGVAGGIDMRSAGDVAVFRPTFKDNNGSLKVYRTDGTAAGTMPLNGAEIADTPPGTRFSVLNGAAYVAAINGLYRVTSTSFDRLFQGTTIGSYVVGDRIYFSGSYNLTSLTFAVGVTDGTVAGTQLLDDPGERWPVGFAAVRNGNVIFGEDNAMRRLPLNAPRLPGFSGHLFRDANANGVYDAGEVRETLAGLNIPDLPIGADGSFDLKWTQPMSITVSASTAYQYVQPTTPTSRTLTLVMGQAQTGIDFGFRRLNIVRGSLRVDANLDEVASDAEPAAPGQTVWADLDEDGVVDATEPAVVTSSTGAFEFGDLPGGRDVLIRVRPLSGWYASAPAAPGFWVHTSVDGGVFPVGNLGVSQQPPPNYISALVFEDLDRDGTWDAGEPLRQNNDIWVDLDDDGVFDPNEPVRSGFVSPRGEARIRLPGPGQYRVRAPLPPGWEATSPPPLVTLGPGERAWGLQLGVAMPAPRGTSISGVTFFDIDHDGTQDAGDETEPADPPNPNISVYLDSDNDSVFDANEPTALSDSLGRFTFNNLAPGPYAVRQLLTGTLWQTTPAPGASIIVDLVAGQQRTNLLFGSAFANPDEYSGMVGTVFLDANVDGVHGAGEGPFRDTATFFFLDADNDALADPAEPRASLSAQGEFQMVKVLPGRYRLRMIPPGGALEVSTGGSDHAPIVDVPPNTNQPIEIGVYRPVSRIASAQFLKQNVPWRVRLEMQDVWDPATIQAAIAVTGPDGNPVTPTQVVFPGGANPIVELQFNRILATGNYTVSIPGTALRGSPGLATPADFAFTFTIDPAAVVGRRLFYNQSKLDGNSAIADFRDDFAIATDKSGLRPGASVAPANISGYSRGINGVMLDIANLPNGGSGLVIGDFGFRATSPDGWITGPTPALSVRRGAGVNGSDRITFVWAETAAVTNGWLEVTMKSTVATGLTSADVFAFGSLVGDINGDGGISVGDLGILATNFNKPSGATIAQGDFNGDGAVTVGDLGILSTAFGRMLAAPPAVGVGPVAILASSTTTAGASKTSGTKAQVTATSAIKSTEPVQAQSVQPWPAVRKNATMISGRRPLGRVR